MTIHKSKGLDFQHVLIPFTDWDINPSTKGNPDYYWWDTTSDDRYTDLFGDINTLPIAFRSTCEKSIYAKPYEHELFMQCIDSFNLLYVAFTRAKTSLTLWGYSKTPKKEIDRSKWNISDIVCITLLNGCNTEYKETDLNSFKTFDDYCTDDKSVCRREEETDGFIHILTKGDYNANFETKNIQGVISSLPFPVGKEEAEEMSFLNFQSREIFRQSSLCGEFWTFDEPFDNQLSPIERGNLFHNALSLIQDVDDVKRVVQQMDNEGLIPLTISSEEMREYLTTKITHPDVIDWFLPGKWHVYNENTILTQQYGNMSQYRPDRVMINPNRTIVVDFKFGQPDLQRHSKQVDRYMKLLCNLGYKQVEGAIWYVEHDKIISL